MVFIIITNNKHLSVNCIAIDVVRTAFLLLLTYAGSTVFLLILVLLQIKLFYVIQGHVKYRMTSLKLRVYRYSQ